MNEWINGLHGVERDDWSAGPEGWGALGGCWGDRVGGRGEMVITADK